MLHCSITVLWNFPGQNRSFGFLCLGFKQLFQYLMKGPGLWELSQSWRIGVRILKSGLAFLGRIFVWNIFWKLCPGSAQIYFFIKFWQRFRRVYSSKNIVIILGFFSRIHRGACRFCKSFGSIWTLKNLSIFASFAKKRRREATHQTKIVTTAFLGVKLNKKKVFWA